MELLVGIIIGGFTILTTALVVLAFKNDFKADNFKKEMQASRKEQDERYNELKSEMYRHLKSLDFYQSLDMKLTRFYNPPLVFAKDTVAVQINDILNCYLNNLDITNQYASSAMYFFVMHLSEHWQAPNFNYDSIIKPDVQISEKLKIIYSNTSDISLKVAIEKLQASLQV